MFTFTSHRFSRTAILAGLVLAGIGTFLTVGVAPAHAQCKYGGAHCVIKGISGPKSGFPKIPGTGWQDVDCAQFGNCDSSELKGTEVRRPNSGQVNATVESNGLKTR